MAMPTGSPRTRLEKRTLVRYYTSRDPSDDILYLSRPGLWQTFGPGGKLLIHSVKDPPRRYVAKLHEIDEAEAWELVYGLSEKPAASLVTGGDLVQRLDEENEWPDPSGEYEGCLSALLGLLRLFF